MISVKKKNFLNYCGLLGIVALLSYTVAVVFSPLDYPGYNWMAQAVSDLSAANAPSLRLWNQLSSLYTNLCHDGLRRDTGKRKQVTTKRNLFVYRNGVDIGSGIFHVSIK
mgnify:CR=1 FL=1